MLKNAKRAIKWALHDEEGKCGEITVWALRVIYRRRYFIQESSIVPSSCLWLYSHLCWGFTRSVSLSMTLCSGTRRPKITRVFAWGSGGDTHAWIGSAGEHASLWSPATNNIHYKCTDLQLSNIVNIGKISVVVKWPKQACKVFDATIQ